MSEEKFAEIVNSTKGLVLGAIKTYLYKRFSHAIDDVAQETYLRAYKSLIKGKFRDSSKPGTWLYIIARNESIRMNERQAREEKKKNRMIDVNIIKRKNSENNYEIADNRLILNELKNNIHDLSDKYRPIFSLMLEGHTEEEISKALSLPCGTVKSRTHRGKKILFKMMSRGG
ncbi:MAG: sigma-70 family RNA polymerase sigma factor [Elusimicrobia bacterium]|nr:sigma-70 family RNA polymerase sigma factor [Elusimicrobiota bacterium]